jgi:hypothetical protein
VLEQETPIYNSGHGIHNSILSLGKLVQIYTQLKAKKLEKYVNKFTICRKPIRNWQYLANSFQIYDFWILFKSFNCEAYKFKTSKINEIIKNI